jgi:hypothetical protein
VLIVKYGKCAHVFWAEDLVGKFITSGSLDHTRKDMSLHTTLVETTQVSASKVSGTEMKTPA